MRYVILILFLTMSCMQLRASDNPQQTANRIDDEDTFPADSRSIDDHVGQLKEVVRNFKRLRADSVTVSFPTSTPFIHQTSSEVVIMLPYNGGSFRPLLRSSHINDVYSRLMSTHRLDVRSQILRALGTDRDPRSPVIIAFWLKDTSKVPDNTIGIRTGSRICDIAAEALDEYYDNPFNYVPANTTGSKDRHVQEWEEWYKVMVRRHFSDFNPLPPQSSHKP